MAHEPFQLRAIEAVSPTLAEALRICKLRAGLSRADSATQYVLGNPKAWLGTAYHAVLEVVGSNPSDDLETQVRELWLAAITNEHTRARAHPLDNRFGPPESWPGYHLVAAMALVRAKQLVEALTQHPMSGTTGGETKRDVLREQKFSGEDGKIVGRPDMVRSEEVVDFKTGEIFEDGDQGQIKDSYVRQLRIYGFLVRETLGWWPRRGVLLPMTGSPVEVGLDPGECKKEAGAAVRLLEEYNAAIARRQDPLRLASPSPTNCRGCAFQLYCPAFWSYVAPGWETHLCAGVIEGRTQTEPSSIHGGLAFSLSIHVDRGTVPAGQHVSLFPLDPSMHTELAQVRAGDRARVTGLWRRADDTLVATKRTMIALERNLPRIEFDA